jgi:hypothetical protein
MLTWILTNVGGDERHWVRVGSADDSSVEPEVFFQRTVDVQWQFSALKRPLVKGWFLFQVKTRHPSPNIVMWQSGSKWGWWMANFAGKGRVMFMPK